PIDIVEDFDCNKDGSATLNDIEPYGFDNYHATVNNTSNHDITVEGVTFTVDDGRGVTSPEQTSSQLIAAGASGDIKGTFTEFVLGSYVKSFAGTGAVVLLGTYNVDFSVYISSDADGSSTLHTSASVTFGIVNRCGG